MPDSQLPAMNLTCFEAARAFLARAQASLERHEAANNLMLGIATRLAEHPDRIKRPPYLATVESIGDEAIVAAAVMTPPHRVILHSEWGDRPEPLRMLAQSLADGGWPVPGVIGPSVPAEAFARVWAAQMGRVYRPAMRERVYELRRVIPPAAVPGRLRLAAESEAPLAAQWVHGFMQDAGLPGTAVDAAEIAGVRINDGDLFFWDHDGPASMAAKARHTAHGIAVSLVYTPPELRRRGYASACVAALSQQLLDAGWQFCALFTDLANPISNDIYQRIGYRPVCDFNEYDFEK